MTPEHAQRLAQQLELGLRVPAAIALLDNAQNAPDPGLRIVVGRNVNTAMIPVPEELGVPLPELTEAHRLARCQPCGAKIWLGPNQMATPGTRTCCLCAAVIRKLLELDGSADDIEYRAAAAAAGPGQDTP